MSIKDNSGEKLCLLQTSVYAPTTMKNKYLLNVFFYSDIDHIHLALSDWQEKKL